MLWGCLPLRRSWKLAHHLDRELWLRPKHGFQVPNKDTDVGFLGKPTCLLLRTAEGEMKYPQRVEWLLELARESSFSWWGGLCVDGKSRGYLQHRYGELSDIFFTTNELHFANTLIAFVLAESFLRLAETRGGRIDIMKRFAAGRSLFQPT